MKRLVFMNHRIRDRKNRKAVITLQSGRGRQRHAHKVEIRIGRVLVATVTWHWNGNRRVTTHDVRAWIEFERCAELRLIRSKPMSSRYSRSTNIRRGD